MSPNSIPHHSHPTSAGIFIRRIEDAGRPAGRDEAHRDNYYIIAILTSGSACGTVDFHEVSIASNQTMIIAPSQVHALRSLDNGARGWMMALAQEMFSTEEIEMLSKYAIHTAPFEVDRSLIADIDKLLELSLRYDKITAISHHGAAMVKALVLRHLPADRGNAPNRHLQITVALKDLLTAHYRDEKRPSAYASMLNISEVYLNEAVKNATGLSASRYIRSQIILEAKRMLAYTTQTPTQIAQALGYDDYSYFSRLFKKETALSPTEFRKNLE